MRARSRRFVAIALSVAATVPVSVAMITVAPSAVWAAMLGDESPAVAIVGSLRMTIADFTRVLARMRHAGDYSTTLQTLTPAGRQSILQSLIDQQLLADAAREEHLDQDPRVRFEIAQAQAAVLAEAVVEKKAQSIKDEAARGYYETHPLEFRAVARANTRHVLARTLDDAQQIRDLLASGAKFETVAKERSIDPYTKDDGGRLGWITRGVMVRQFEDALFSLKPGEISQVIKTSYGYHVIRVDEFDGGELPAFDAVKDRVKQAMLAKDLDRLKEQLTKKYGVTIDKDVLADLGIK